ncbi:uncharacterized protein DUF4236 [Micromonospora pisi]|uniref:Uncharacterized protein DUF4236 n=1 Tax=Micromonospora pisi TaxID=589240 RepID=A0A495JPK2_9ACTN|nr:uncharacterized protein DUF4236 [Micromonospora pisi]
MGFSFKIAPGVRIRTSKRGIRTSIGPRAARVHIGAGKTRFSTGVGPVGYVTSGGTGNGKSKGKSVQRGKSATPSVRQRPTRPTGSGSGTAENNGRVRIARQIDRQIHKITSVHRGSVPEAVRPIAVPARRPARLPIYLRARRQELDGVRPWQRQARAAAVRRARELADVQVAQVFAEREQAQAEEQQRLDERWQKLCDNHPVTVRETVAAAFARQKTAVATVSVEDGQIALVATVGHMDDVVPGDEALKSVNGYVLIRSRSLSDRVRLYREHVCGTALAAARQAFAAAPGLSAARVVVLRQDGEDSYGTPRHSGLYALRVTRDALTSIRWDQAGATDIVQDSAGEETNSVSGFPEPFTEKQIRQDPSVTAFLARLSEPPADQKQEVTASSAVTSPPDGKRPRPFLLLFGWTFLCSPFWHAYNGVWTDHRHIATSMLVYPTTGLLLLRLRMVKRGAAPPAGNSGSRLFYLLAVMWAAGPALLAGDRWLYGGSVSRDVVAFIGSSLICWIVALTLYGWTVPPRGAEPVAPPRRLNVPATAALIALLVVIVNVYPTGSRAAAPVNSQAVATAPPVPDPSVTAPAVTSTPPATTVAEVMPDLVGRRLPDAEQALYALTTDVAPSHQDRSPLDRDVWMRDNWTVVGTLPAAGTSIGPGLKIEMFLLKNSEAAWFAQHPVMPKIKAGADALDLTGEGEPLDGMSELVELRYAKNKTPKDARDPNENFDGWEPAEEKTARAGLKQAYTGLVVGSVPTAERKLRTGQLIIVTVKDGPDSPSSGGSDSVPSLPDNNDGDDDVNVPGRLCPTRFC